MLFYIYPKSAVKSKRLSIEHLGIRANVFTLGGAYISSAAAFNQYNRYQVFYSGIPNFTLSIYRVLPAREATC